MHVDSPSIFRVFYTLPEEIAHSTVHVNIIISARIQLYKDNSKLTEMKIYNIWSELFFWECMDAYTHVGTFYIGCGGQNKNEWTKYLICGCLQ